MPLSRRQLALGGAALIVLMLAAWTLWPSTPAKVVVPAAAAARGTAAAAHAAPGEVAPVRLDALHVAREGPGDGARNPFRFQPKVVPPPPRPVLTAPMPSGPVVPPPPPGPPPLPPIPLKFTGLVERANGVKWAVLVDGKGGLMYGKDGDIIDGRYVIVKIGTESVEMTYADGRGRQVIRLTGQ
jgi:hypothetical protein